MLQREAIDNVPMRRWGRVDREAVRSGWLRDQTGFVDRPHLAAVRLMRLQANWAMHVLLLEVALAKLEPFKRTETRARLRRR